MSQKEIQSEFIQNQIDLIEKNAMTFEQYAAHVKETMVFREHVDYQEPIDYSWEPKGSPPHYVYDVYTPQSVGKAQQVLLHKEGRVNIDDKITEENLSFSGQSHFYLTCGDKLYEKDCKKNPAWRLI